MKYHKLQNIHQSTTQGIYCKNPSFIHLHENTLKIWPLANSAKGKTAIPKPERIDIMVVLSKLVVTSPIYPYIAICNTE